MLLTPSSSKERGMATVVGRSMLGRGNVSDDWALWTMCLRNASVWLVSWMYLAAQCPFCAHFVHCMLFLTSGVYFLLGSLGFRGRGAFAQGALVASGLHLGAWRDPGVAPSTGGKATSANAW